MRDPVQIDTPDDTPAPEEAPSGLPLWLLVIIGIGALLIAGVIISRIAPFLAGVIAPPEPPIFQPAAQIEYRAEAHGLDHWSFETETDACTVYLWYEERATACRLYDSSLCTSTAGADPAQIGTNDIGYCQGRVSFGEFSADWEIYISESYNETDGIRTLFTVARNVDWLSGGS